MRFFSFHRSAYALFSFAGAGIARVHRHAGHPARHNRRRAGSGVVHLSSERLEGRAVLAGASLAGFTPDLITADDSGLSTTDNITNVTTPTFRFTPTGVTFASGGETIQLRVNGSVVATSAVPGGLYAGGPISLTSTALTDNTYPITLTSTDGTTAGTSSASLFVTIDTTPPTVSSITTPATQTYIPNGTDTISFGVVFNERVYVVGSPILPVTIGSGASSLTAPDVQRDATATASPPGSSATSQTFSYVVGSLAGNPLTPESSDANGVQVGTALSTTVTDDILDVAGNSAATAIPLGIQTAANTAMAFRVLVNAAPTAEAEWFDPSGNQVTFPASTAGMLPPRVTPIPNLTIKFTNKTTGLPQAVPFSTSAPASPPSPPFGAGTLTLDDFVLTRNGTVVPWTSSVKLTCPVSGSDAFATYQLSGLETLTNTPGSYAVTFSDIGLADSRTVSWVKDYATPVELRATFAPNPGLTSTGTTPRTVTPLDSVTVTFVDAAGAGGGTPTPVPVTGVVVNQAPDPTQFQLYRDGVLVPGFNLTAMINGSGSTYTITGLKTLTDKVGAYELRLLSSNNGIKSVLDADVNPNGSTLKADESIKWQYSHTTIDSVSEVSLPANYILGVGGTYKIGETIEYAVLFVDPAGNPQEVNVAPGTSPSLQFTIDSGTGGPVRNALYNRGSGSSVLIFSYTVQPMDLDANGVAFNPSLNGAANITDTSGLPIFNTFAAPVFIPVNAIDGVAPSVASVTLPAAGVYTTGNLDFAVTFNDVVNVVTTGGTPSLTVTIGGVARQAIYQSGSGSSTLVFRYAITAADSASGAAGSVAVVANSLNLNGGTIRDVNANDATLAVPATSTSGVIVNRLAATVTATAGTFKLGQTIDLTATFTQPVNVTGTPTITGTVSTVTGSRPVTFNYISGTGTTAIKFRTTVAANDLDADGIDITGLFNGTINDLNGNAVGVSFTPPTTLAIDGVAPTVTITPILPTLPFNGSSGIIFTLSKPSTNFAAGDVICTGGTLSNFQQTSPNVYTANIAPSTDTTGNVVLSISADAFSDSAGNGNAATTFTIGIAPSVTITVTPSKLRAGQTATVTFTFSEAITTGSFTTADVAVTGGAITPPTGSGAVYTATFTPAVGFSGDANITVGAAAVTDLAGNGNTAGTLNIPVDVAPRILSSGVIVPANGLYTTGGSLVFTVPFNKAVVVSGSPSLSVRIGSAVRQAAFDAAASAPASGVLVFSYLVTAADASSSGISIDADSINLNGGTIRDGAGNDGVLLHPGVSAASVFVNRTPLQSVTLSSANNTFYRIGESIQLTATFGTPVTVIGTPSIGLSFNGAIKQATYLTGTGTNTLTFSYTVVNNDEDLDGIEFASTALNVPTGASISYAGAAAMLVFSPPDVSGVRVDARTPVLQTVIPPTARTYTVGEPIQFVANFSESMRVTPQAGTGNVPRIAIVIGSTTRYATFVAGSETPTLVFEYQVQAGDTDSDGILAATAITLNGALITDLAGNPSPLSFLPQNTSGVLVDGLAPTVTRFSTTFPNGRYTVGTLIPITATMSENVQAGSSIDVVLDTGAIVNLVAATAGRTLQGTYRVNMGENSSDLTVASFTDAGLFDIAGNSLGTPTLPSGANNIGGIKNIIIDTLAPMAPVLSLASDTGASPSDGITSNGTVNVGGLEAGAAWQFSTNGGISWNVGTGTSFTLPAGTYPVGTVQARQTDLAGNTSPVGSNATALTIDLTVQAPTLSLASDTGSSPSDGITNNGTVNVGGLETGASWQFSTNGGATWTNGTGSSFTLPAGTYAVGAVQARQTDLAGNASTAGFNTAAITVDTTTAAAPAVALASDTGVSPSDGITNNGTVNVTGLETGALWQYSSNGGVNWTNGTGSSFTLPAGSYAVGSIQARQTDVAGNTSAAGSNAAAISVDTLAQTPVLSLTSDTGASPSDGITSNGTVNVGGLEAGAAWQFSTNGGISWNVGTGTSFTLPAGTYPVGTVQARQTDLAGNTSPVGSNATALTIDLTVQAPTLSLASDTGSSPSDGITNNGTVNVGGLEPGASWQYSTNGGATWTNGTGSSFTLPAGTYAIGAVQARQTDLAGNASTAGSIASVITVDTTSAAAPTLSLANDTGAGSADGITSNGTVNVGGLEPGAAWQYSTNGGTTWSNGTGSSFTLPAGSYAAGAVQARQTDTAGNTSPVGSNATAISVDTSAQAPVLSLASDTGASPSDGITSNGTVNVGGLEAGAAWQFSTNGGISWNVGTGTSFTLPAGTYPVGTVQARQTDLAGNTSPVGSNAGAIGVDAIAPTVIALSASPSGTVRAGDIVTLTATLSEAVQPGSSLTVKLDTGNLVELSTTAASSILTGTFTVQIGESSTGLRFVAIALTPNGVRDLAGNLLVSTAVPEQSAGAGTLAIDAAIKSVTPAGFSSNPALIPNRPATVTRIPITFNAPVSGFSLASVKVLLNGRSVSLRGATLVGSGANYILTLPSRVANAKGIYTLQISAGSIYATANGAAMADDQAIYWGKGTSVGFAAARAPQLRR